MCADIKMKIASRAAKEVQEGQVINLGIGIPTLVMDVLPPEMTVTIHSENGVLGVSGVSRRGEEDRNLIDAGGGYITVGRGAAFCDSALSFSLVRSGRLDLAFLGALEVAENGDLANWIIPGKFAPGIGGGMELAQKARRLIIATTHTTRKGEPKILRQCTLPLTAKACVDCIITELAVIQVTPEGLKLTEIAEETDVETVIGKTEAPLILPVEIHRF